MIIAIIYALHLVFTLVIFTRKYQDDSLADAFQNVALIIILFFVGWPLVTMLAKVFWDPTGFGVHLDRDTIALTLLTILEFFFYKFYYKEYFITEDDKGKQ